MGPQKFGILLAVKGKYKVCHWSGVVWVPLRFPFLLCLNVDKLLANIKYRSTVTIRATSATTQSSDGY